MKPTIEICCHEAKGFGRGANVFIVCERIKANAAHIAVPMIVKFDQPNKKEKKFPNERRRYSYIPPDSSVRDARPDRLNALNSVTMPAIVHANNIQVSLNPVCDIGTIFLKTPDPMIRLVTNNVAVNKPKVLFKVVCEKVDIPIIQYV